MKYICPCGYEYDPAVGAPDNGSAPGTPWEDVPEDWVCPVCGLDKSVFEEAKTKNQYTRHRLKTIFDPAGKQKQTTAGAAKSCSCRFLSSMN